MSELVTYHILRILHMIEERFTFAAGYRGSIILISGGLFLLTFLIAYAMAKSAFGRGHSSPRPSREVRSVIVEWRSAPQTHTLQAPTGAGAFDRGFKDAQAARDGSVDDLLDRMYEAGIGDPRIVGSTARAKLVRLYACASCRAGDTTGCGYAAGFLGGGISALIASAVSVTEVGCRRDGHLACEFEVTYP